MADDFYFFTPLNSDKEVLYISGKGRWSPDIEEAIVTKHVTDIVITQWQEPTLDNFEPFAEQIRRLWVEKSNISDVSAVSKMKNIEDLVLLGGLEQVDFSGLHRLRRCSLTSDRLKTNIGMCAKLKDLTLIGMKSVEIGCLSSLGMLASLSLQEMQIKSLDDLNGLHRLRHLAMTKVALHGLHGVGGLIDLESLILARMDHLRDIRDLGQLGNLKDLVIASCHKLQSLDVIGQICKLKTLRFENMEISSLHTLSDLEFLETLLLLERTNVVDGDMGCLLNMPSLKQVMFKNRRHYSHKSTEINSRLGQRG